MSNISEYFNITEKGQKKNGWYMKCGGKWFNEYKINENMASVDHNKDQIKLKQYCLFFPPFSFSFFQNENKVLRKKQKKQKTEA